MPEQGLLIVISGPSGAGKGTICTALMEREPNLRYSVSATTRLPRQGEVDGKNYLFMDKEKFIVLREQGEFLEWAEVYGNFYGTPRKNVEAMLNKGYDVILEIDIQGALQVKEKFPQGVFIFILPPSLEELETRITKRGTDTKDVIARRMSAAVKELAYVSEYDYVVVNDQVDAAVQRVRAIITAEKCRLQRKKINIDLTR